MEGLNPPEIIRDRLHIAAKVGEVFHQMQISAKTDPVNLFPEQCAAHVDPVLFRIADRVSSLAECGGSAQPNRE